MGQQKNRVKICQRIFINNCQLTHFCCCRIEFLEMFRLGLEEQQLINKSVLKNWVLE